MFLTRLNALIEGRSLTADSDGGDEGGTGVIERAPAGAPSGGSSTSVLGGGAPDAGDEGDAGAPTAFSWPENWRDVVAGDDAEARKLIEKFASPEDIRKKLVNQEKAIRSGRHKLAGLPEKATDVEIAEYRKAAGVPDKPEGYGFEFPKEVQVTDADKQMLGEFSKFMNERHVPPGAAKPAFEFYIQQMAETQAARAEAEREVELENLAELRAAFPGRQYAPTIELAVDYMEKVFFEGDRAALDAVLEARLPSGVKLGTFAPFVKLIAAKARAAADEGTIIAGDAAGSGGQTAEEEYKALITKSVDKPREMSARDEARLRELATAKARREERRDIRAA